MPINLEHRRCFVTKVLGVFLELDIYLPVGMQIDLGHRRCFVTKLLGVFLEPN